MSGPDRLFLRIIQIWLIFTVGLVGFQAFQAVFNYYLG